ncbi:MAG: hypothetical protein M1327_06360 [Candidatus Thermoplasmatota archaeon]|nr:hypothetical protein [Candidatus Thermoplasmatota archaeon]
MPQKRHCLICGGLIFSGLYCSSCFVEMRRIRTQDEPSFDEWLSLTRGSRPSLKQMPSEGKDLYIFDSTPK